MRNTRTLLAFKGDKETIYLRKNITVFTAWEISTRTNTLCMHAILEDIRIGRMTYTFKKATFYIASEILIHIFISKMNDRQELFYE